MVLTYTLTLLIPVTFDSFRFGSDKLCTPNYLDIPRPKCCSVVTTRVVCGQRIAEGTVYQYLCDAQGVQVLLVLLLWACEPAAAEDSAMAFKSAMAGTGAAVVAMTLLYPLDTVCTPLPPYPTMYNFGHSHTCGCP